MRRCRGRFANLPLGQRLNSRLHNIMHQGADQGSTGGPAVATLLEHGLPWALQCRGDAGTGDEHVGVHHQQHRAVLRNSDVLLPICCNTPVVGQIDNHHVDRILSFNARIGPATMQVNPSATVRSNMRDYQNAR